MELLFNILSLHNRQFFVIVLKIVQENIDLLSYPANRQIVLTSNLQTLNVGNYFKVINKCVLVNISEP